ncbi:purine-binding chemotaxis protein CheW [Mameliella alba]|uniref:chemotaxis protein CheW n=1 Tax=Mameliella alba TaxID=561184 RepID=UPI00088E9E58|nr:chemotaxis protein CheW [Mameliella alba]OWV41627.1 chemotaxis protein CheW [Mameliella alba]PTR34683.1 purine-binding chemotaxis protein CheW [Mameliella alba]GGF83557.1 chemotaxis protein CheW [Mameliella alba]SDE22739.1 purine-binding chemotaxis protein CheW [Mameliella alba]
MAETAEAHADTQFEFITFSAGGQSYCLEITQIREIRRWTPVTALPHTPADVLGVMNLRGAVIPIFDLSARFGLGATPANERNVVIVAAVDGATIGLQVESVSEILSVDKSEIQETPDIKSEATRNSIQGMISVDDTMVRVVNLGAVVESGKGLPA